MSTRTAIDAIDRLVASQCCIPDWTLDRAVTLFGSLGFRKMEAFTHWTKSALDAAVGDRDAYRRAAANAGLAISSLHLPVVAEGDAGLLERALAGVACAAALGAGVGIVRGKTRPAYIEALPALLDAAEAVGLTLVIENHRGMAIETLEHMREVVEGVADPRLKLLLEVSHLHYVGISWRRAYEQFRGRIALVHVKDVAAGQCVPFGEGEIDFPGLFAQLAADGYGGDYVVELEGACRADAPRYLGQAIEYLKPLVEQ